VRFPSGPLDHVLTCGVARVDLADENEVRAATSGRACAALRLDGCEHPVCETAALAAPGNGDASGCDEDLKEVAAGVELEMGRRDSHVSPQAYENKAPGT
jgi:hypothetical protein